MDINTNPEPRGGQFLKGYELHEQIGAGGFGVVYRGFQPLLKRTVAIKAILPQYANHPDFIRRFEVEAELVARLEHPHIIPLYDYWREPDGAYLVMRWLGGGSLRHALEAGPWDTERTARLVDEICSALIVAHRHGVVHRDIKPDNVLLDEDSNAYLADFGIAKVLGGAEITQGGAIGSPAYFAPEQIRSEMVTAKTDQYSLGLMLFEVLTGSRPFPDASLSELFMKYLNEPLPALRDFRSELPAGLDAVIQRATAKDPDERFDDVLALAAAFHQALVPSTTARTPTDDETITDLLTDLVVDLRTSQIDLPPPPNPYKGLHAFQEADAVDFFGRASLVEQLLRRLRENGAESRFLAIVGPSGSGKSSVVKAGLVPQLRQGAMPNSDRWFIAQMVPGVHPLEELEVALLRVAANPPEHLLRQLEEDERGLLRAARRILPDDASELVLVIDQFEEVFTLVEEPAVREHLLNSLAAAVLDPKSQVRVIVTLRADFYDRPLQYRQFGELIRQRMESVLPLSTDELSESIVAPAQRVGVTVETELVTAIIRDISDQPGSLPLLQYALTELFERQQGRRLMLATYYEIGGISGALARRAEELFEALSPQQQDATRQLFLRLVTLGEGSEDTRRRVRQSELSTSASNDEGLAAVLDAYGRARLLTFDRDPNTRGPTVEIAHEALLRVWGRFHDWIEESREDVRTQRKLASAAREWTDAGDDPSFLATGTRLAQFEEWASESRLGLNTDESRFLERSVAEREAQRTAEAAREEYETALALRARNRLRWLVAALSVFLVVALGLSLFAVDRQQQAETQAGIAADNAETALAARADAEQQSAFAQAQAEMAANNAATATIAQGIAVQQSALAQTQAAIADQNALRAQALALAASSQLVLNSGETDLALLLALEANRMVDVPSIEIQRALTAAAYAPGTHFLLSGHTLPIVSVAVSPDGQTALSVAGDETTVSRAGELILWNLATGTEIRRLQGHNHKVVSAAFDPEGRTAISGDWDGVLILWDLATGMPIRRFQNPGGLNRQVAFSPDGLIFASSGGDFDHSIQIWDLTTGEITHRLSGHTDQLDSIAFSPDGTYLASGARNGELILWNVETGTEVRRFEGHADAINDLDFSPDGKILLSGGSDIGLVLWDVETGSEIRRILTGIVYAAVFSPDGNTVLSGLGAGTSGTLTLWDANTGAEVRRYVGHSAPVSSAAFTPDGRQILSGSQDGSLRLWYANSGAEVERIRLSDGIEGLAISPDGQRVLSGLRDGSVVLSNIATGEEIFRLEGHSDIVRSVDFSPNGHTGVSGSLDGMVILWDLDRGEEIRRFEGHPDVVLSVDISPDDQFILSAGFDSSGQGLSGELLLWDIDSSKVIRRLDAPVLNAILSPDGRTALISVPGYGQNEVRVWDIQTGETIKTFAVGAEPAWGLAVSPDGQLALLGMADSTVRLWNVAASEEVRRFVGHTDLVNDVAFSPDGRSVVSASGDETFILWDIDTGAEVHRFAGHTGLVRRVTFSPDGDFALSGGRDAMLRLWRVFSTTDDLLLWVHANRYEREWTCAERQQYRIDPLCSSS